jgi:ubiquinone/menaquinone biosynthesis C-methylase UbiE
MPNFNQRSEEAEIMDDFALDTPALIQTLKELEFINFWLGGNQVTVSAFNYLKKIKKKAFNHVSIVDVGCGSGDMLRLLSDWVLKNQIKATLYGVDANSAVTNFAIQRTKNYPDITYLTEDVTQEPFINRQFDVITCTLFAHHFADDALLLLLKQWHRQAKIGIIINDLHRHPLAYYSIKWLTRWFSKSEMTKYDSKLSVLRAFSKTEIEQLLIKAGWSDYHISWKWAFRWQITAWK